MTDIYECPTCQSLREEIADMTNEMREMQREHDYQMRQLESEMRFIEREAAQHGW